MVKEVVHNTRLSFPWQNTSPIVKTVLVYREPQGAIAELAVVKQSKEHGEKTSNRNSRSEAIQSLKVIINRSHQHA